MFRTLMAATVVSLMLIAPVKAVEVDVIQPLLDGGIYVNADLGSTFKSDSGRDNSNVMNFSAGIAANDVRVELGLNRNSTGDNTNLGEVEIDSILSGLYLDFNNDSRLTPFVGVNFGYGWADGSGVSDSNADGIVYGASTGLSYSVSENWDLVGKYQYLRSEEIEVVNASGVEDYDSHAATVGIRYTF